MATSVPALAMLLVLLAAFKLKASVGCSDGWLYSRTVFLFRARDTDPYYARA